jgi:soluble lytic murein transglycosylase
MRFLNGALLAIFTLVIWFVSHSLTNYRLSLLERSGEIPYGPIPTTYSNSYSFNRDSTFLMREYPIERVNDLTKFEFENIILNSVSLDDRRNLTPILTNILTTSEEFQLDPFWMLSIVMVESRFLNNSTSNKNAMGLMQIRPETAIHITQLMNKEIKANQIELYLFNTENNLELGAFYLKKLLQNFHLDFKHATIAYNLGPNKLKNIISDKILNLDSNEYFENVNRNYTIFTNKFKNNIKKIPNIYEKSYVVSEQGIKLEELLINQLGIFTYFPYSSQNLLAY